MFQLLSAGTENEDFYSCMLMTENEDCYICMLEAEREDCHSCFMLVLEMKIITYVCLWQRITVVVGDG